MNIAKFFAPFLMLFCVSVFVVKSASAQVIIHYPKKEKTHSRIIKSGAFVRGKIKDSEKNFRGKMYLLNDSFLLVKNDTILISDLNLLEIRSIDWIKMGLLAYCIGGTTWFFIRFPSMASFQEAETLTQIRWGSSLLTRIPASIYLLVQPSMWKPYYLLRDDTWIEVNGKTTFCLPGKPQTEQPE